MKASGRLFIENRIGGSGARFAADPCLDGIETLGSLVDVVEIRDVVDRGQELIDTIVPIANRDQPLGTVVKITFDALARLPDPIGHDRPRSRAKQLLTLHRQTYAKGREIQTTNMSSGEVDYNIFGRSGIEE
jgi:hypothetical protein